MDDLSLREQIEYYRARAPEYEATAVPKNSPEWQAARQVVQRLSQFETILELACGTGYWTQELVRHTAQLTAVDAAPEMLDFNRARVNDSRVRYECVNLFEWEPTQKFDLVFFAFWLSHVPESLLESFLMRVQRAVKKGGHVFLVDEPRGTKNVLTSSTQGNRQARTLNDGRTFNIVKEYYAPDHVCAQLTRLGFGPIEIFHGDYFFWISAAFQPSGASSD